jgi:hypothetical protein
MVKAHQLAMLAAFASHSGVMQRRVAVLLKSLEGRLDATNSSTAAILEDLDTRLARLERRE